MRTPKIEVCKKICNECGFTGAPDVILSLDQLKDHHKGLREDVYLNNGNYIF